MSEAVQIYEAIGEIRDSYIAEAEHLLYRRRRPFLRKLAAACILLLLLVLPVGAELKNGYVSNLLAPLYGGAQTKIVDSIGVPLDASVTVGDYTLKAGSVAIDASGVNSGDPETDLAGNPRGVGSAYDCGAFEYQGASPTSLPYSDVADAVFASLDKDELAVDFDVF